MTHSSAVHTRLINALDNRIAELEDEVEAESGIEEMERKVTKQLREAGAKGDMKQVAALQKELANLPRTLKELKTYQRAGERREACHSAYAWCTSPLVLLFLEFSVTLLTIIIGFW